MSREKRQLFRAAVFVIIRDQQGRVLLQRRAGTGYLDGHYDFPSGHVDVGEGFAAAAVREVAEETNIKIAEQDLQLKHASINVLDYPYINIIFETEKWSGEPTIVETDKCDDMAFFAIDGLPEHCSLAVRYVEEAGFNVSSGTSYVDQSKFTQLMSGSFDEINNIS